MGNGNPTFRAKANIVHTISSEFIKLMCGGAQREAVLQSMVLQRFHGDKPMNSVDKKRTPERVPPKKKNGVMAEQVDLSNPVNRTAKEAEAEEQTLLPHERDQTTRSAGTSQPNENEMSRDVIGQAADDTRRGLKDTDRRGIPSDIVKSDGPESGQGADVPEQARNKKK